VTAWHSQRHAAGIAVKQVQCPSTALRRSLFPAWLWMRDQLSAARLQNSQLEDAVTLKEQELAAAQKDVLAMRLELDDQGALLGEFEGKLARQAADAERTISDLHAQLAAAVAGPQPPRTAGAAEAVDATADLEAQLLEAEAGIRALAAEKVQLLEAYELLEEDTGRLIDEAVAAQQARSAELSLQVEARAALRCCSACTLARCSQWHPCEMMLQAQRHFARGDCLDRCRVAYWAPYQQ
jgi:hypothetical protein